jgi:hypothetical protein
LMLIGGEAMQSAFHLGLNLALLHAVPAYDYGIKRNGAPERIRTSDPQIRSLMLYPAELRARIRRHSKCPAVLMRRR